MRFYILILSLLYSSFCLVIKAQVGINTTDPTEFLDVNGNIRIRDAVNIDALPDPSDYINLLKMNSSGVWGYVKYRKPNNYNFYNVYSFEMSEPVTSTQVDGSIPLGISVKVEVPPLSTAIFLIDYNIPISVDRNMAESITSFDISYTGITLFKTGSIELQNGSRKFTVFAPASMEITSIGMPVLGKSVQKVENTTTNTMYIDYYLNGYIESNTSSLPVHFGMSSTSHQSYNWGKPIMTVTSFVKDMTSA